MLKKSFKDQNPALQFISTAQDNMQPLSQDPSGGIPSPQIVPPANHPTMSDERKSKRLNLLLTPSLFQSASKLARMQQTSVNALICSLLLKECQREEASILRFDEVFGTLED